MDQWISVKDCTGCFSCLNICETNAIQVRIDKLSGFFYPSIDQSKCHDCGYCRSICPIENRPTRSIPRDSDAFDYRNHCYAVKSLDVAVRKASTSGGVFSELATFVLSEGGKVYGAAYDSDMSVVHIGIDKIEDLYRLQKSKYVQSDICGIYNNILQDLILGKTVFFVGCPCQVAGIYAFLQNDFPNFYTAEFICMGVNSPMAYRAWLSELEEKYQSPIEYIWFKDKEKGWRQSPFSTRVKFHNGQSIVFDEKDNYFMKGYLQGGLFVRGSCTRCHFMGEDRIGDIVIGDYWGRNTDLQDIDGTSVVILMRSHGKQLFGNILNKIEYRKIAYDDVLINNPRYSTPIYEYPQSKQFFEDLSSESFSKVVRKHIGEEAEVCDFMNTVILPEKKT